ncbi:uncharacterized protein VP01_1617g1 [Puccinia sorghi]|uniref:Uncharacterized protein n=1 Tax=Puccinia sorghi TaxID=27349 RepID=A0A0L6VIW9_9BASI|nr:uncharacterized protein VP01_1617g1 [Puccinia sorghi]
MGAPPPPVEQHAPFTGDGVNQQAYRYQAHSAPEFEHLSRLEPMKIKDLWFSGDLAQLLSFLPHIWDFLHPHGLLFQSETRRVVWILRHFGFAPLDHWCCPSPAENWYNSLVIDNARKAGVHDFYVDLDGQEFTLPTLVSVPEFLDGLIKVFGDKFINDNAKRALAVCKQSHHWRFNSQFKSLVYLVEGVEDSCIQIYVQGLNPRIIRKAMSKEWIKTKTLGRKMELASEALWSLYRRGGSCGSQQ